MAVKVSSAKTKVTYKSPKSDVWQAYKELLGELEEKPVTQQTTVKLEKTTQTLKTSFLKNVDDLHDLLTEKVHELEAQFSQAVQVLSELHQTHETQKRSLSQLQEGEQKQKEREEEEYTYKFEKQKRRQEDELSELKQQVLDELNQRKTAIKEQEDELADLRNQSKTFEAKMEKAVEEAVEKTTVELTREFKHEKALAEQEAKSTQSLLGQNVENLSKVITDLKKENERLNTALNQISANMTRIAERAVEKAPVSPSPSPQTSSK